MCLFRSKVIIINHNDYQAIKCYSVARERDTDISLASASITLIRRWLACTLCVNPCDTKAALCDTFFVGGNWRLTEVTHMNQMWKRNNSLSLGTRMFIQESLLLLSHFKQWCKTHFTCIHLGYVLEFLMKQKKMTHSPAHIHLNFQTQFSAHYECGNLPERSIVGSLHPHFINIS